MIITCLAAASKASNIYMTWSSIRLLRGNRFDSSTRPIDFWPAKRIPLRLLYLAYDLLLREIVKIDSVEVFIKRISKIPRQIASEMLKARGEGRLKDSSEYKNHSTFASSVMAEWTGWVTTSAKREIYFRVLPCWYNCVSRFHRDRRICVWSSFVRDNSIRASLGALYSSSISCISSSSASFRWSSPRYEHG